MLDSTRQLVRTRAGHACEYCRMPQRVYQIPFHVEHVIAVQHGGTDDPENLALACQPCNNYKGPNLASLDPDTGRLTRLFHPRTDVWDDHFMWSGHLLVGRTDIGRMTVALLVMDHPTYRSVRAALMLEGDFPPQ